MPMTFIIPSDLVMSYQEVLLELEKRILKFFKLIEPPEVEYVYEVDMSNVSKPYAGRTRVGVAKVGSKYALYAPDNLTEEQLSVFEFLMREAEENDEFIVFSERDYNAVKKYLHGKKADVELMKY